MAVSDFKGKIPTSHNSYRVSDVTQLSHTPVVTKLNWDSHVYLDHDTR